MPEFCFGQDSIDTANKWKVGGELMLTSSLVTLTHWASGGDNTISLNGMGGIFTDMEDQRQSWENSVDLAYGVIRDDKMSTFRKSNDNIILESKYGYQIIKDNMQWHFSGLVNFKTQFHKGYSLSKPDSIISKFMSPGILVVGLGIDYHQKDWLSVNYVPLSGKITYLSDPKLAESGAFGVTPGSRRRRELGSFFSAKYQDKLFDKVTMESKLELFTNYVVSFGNIDVNWLNKIEIAINQWIRVRYSFHLMYDDDIQIEIDQNNDGVVDLVGPRIQTKSVMGVGISLGVGDQRID